MTISLACGLVASLLLSLSALHAADDYVLGPDSKKQDGVPQGEITKHTFESSKLFPGTWREYWIYVPKQYQFPDRANGIAVWSSRLNVTVMHQAPHFSSTRHWPTCHIGGVISGSKTSIR